MVKSSKSSAKVANDIGKQNSPVDFFANLCPYVTTSPASRTIQSARNLMISGTFSNFLPDIEIADFFKNRR